MGDLLLLCFCLYWCMHFDFLSRSLENYEPDALAEAKNQQFIADFVKKHQILLKYYYPHILSFFLSLIRV